MYNYIGQCASGLEFTMTSTVIPTGAVRQGLNQTRPCPRDIMFFTCTASQSTTPGRVSFMSLITPQDTMFRYLAIFARNNDVGHVSEGSRAGVSGILLNNQTFKFTLTINLRESTVAGDSIVNGTAIWCGDENPGVISPTIYVNIFGK